MQSDPPMLPGLLVLPRLRIQNANAISAPMTWGFPSITAFMGCMHALERKLHASTGLRFCKVGVVCHHFEAQVTQGGFTRSFHLTRNPVDKDGSTAAIVEEGRIHLEVTLVFDVELPTRHASEDERQALAQQVADTVAGMRVAGGSVMPPLASVTLGRPVRPSLSLQHDDVAERRKAFRLLSRRWLPGFALVSRDDLLQSRLEELKRADRHATVLDAWLSLSRLTHRATRVVTPHDKASESAEAVTWSIDRLKGWIVPIPVGYSALSPLYEPGEVANARDGVTPFRFVESAYSIGQWISPHRLTDPEDLLWITEYDAPSGQYRCVNDYRAPAPTAPATSNI